MTLKGDHLDECMEAADRDRTDARVLAWVELAGQHGLRRVADITSAMWFPDEVLRENP